MREPPGAFGELRGEPLRIGARGGELLRAAGTLAAQQPGLVLEAVHQRRLGGDAVPVPVLLEQPAPRRLGLDAVPRRHRGGVRLVVAHAIGGRDRGEAVKASALGQAEHEVPVLEQLEALVVAQVGRGVHQADERDVVRRQQPVRVERLAVDHEPASGMVAAVGAEDLFDLFDVGVGDAVGVAAGEKARQGRQMVGEEEVVVVEIGDEAPTRGVEPGVQGAGATVRRRAMDEGQAAFARRRREKLRRRPFAAVRDHDRLEVAQRLRAQAGQGLGEQRRPVACPDDDGDERRRHGCSRR